MPLQDFFLFQRIGVAPISAYSPATSFLVVYTLCRSSQPGIGALLALLHYGPARFLIRGFAMAPAVLIAPWLLLLLYVRVYRNTGLTDWVEVEVQSKDQYFWGCLQLLDALADRLH